MNEWILRKLYIKHWLFMQNQLESTNLLHLSKAFTKIFMWRDLYHLDGWKWPIPLADFYLNFVQFSELWPILLIFNVHRNDRFKMTNSVKSARGIGHFKIATFSHLSGMFFYYNVPQKRSTLKAFIMHFCSFKPQQSLVDHT